MSAGAAPARDLRQAAPGHAQRSAAEPQRWTREASIDFFRGLGLWMIFIDHLDPNIWSRFSLWRVGFSDFAEVFVFLSGFINVGSWEKIVDTGSMRLVAQKLGRRIARLYIAHLLSLYISIALVMACAAGGLRMNDPSMYRWTPDPLGYLGRILVLAYAPHIFSLLLLYLIIAPLLPFMILGFKRAPLLTLALSGGVWGLSQFSWIQSWVSNPHLYFQPLAWQFLFVLGASARYFSTRLERLARSRWAIAAAAGVVAVTAVLKGLTHFPWAVHLLNPWLYRILMRNSGKPELAPYRLVHFLALLVLAYLFMSWRRGWLRWWVPRLAIFCGIDSLFIYACSLILDTAGNLALAATHGDRLMQLSVSVSGIAILCTLAWMRQKRSAVARSPHPIHMRNSAE